MHMYRYVTDINGLFYLMCVLIEMREVRGSFWHQILQLYHISLAFSKLRKCCSDTFKNHTLLKILYKTARTMLKKNGIKTREVLSKWGSRGKRKENKHVGDHRAPHLGPLFWGTVVHTHFSCGEVMGYRSWCIIPYRI